MNSPVQTAPQEGRLLHLLPQHKMQSVFEVGGVEASCKEPWMSKTISVIYGPLQRGAESKSSAVILKLMVKKVREVMSEETQWLLTRSVLDVLLSVQCPPSPPV